MKRSENTIRILLADEHRLVCSAVSSLIETFDNMTVVAEVNSEQQLMREVAHYRVDVALIDSAVVALSGLESLTYLTDLCPGIRIIVLSTYSSDNFIRRLLSAHTKVIRYSLP
ncbi:response regulator transcription factor, partial [Halomonas meridiana]|uniref:response regulator n=1 Tax=Vreelandella aquamarina TaxID=77097 RepID=UPI001E4EBE65